jgi:beta-glucosidase
MFKKQNDFHWGISTSAFQTEGGFDTDGKGKSIWDQFSHRYGKVYKGHKADVSCDFYHLYETDLDIIKELAIPNFRLSISWSRIFPGGVGCVNRKGVDFYNRLIDACLERGIEPWLTLYHWDLPYLLEQRGGWTNRDSVSWFTDYVERCAMEFGDRVNYWMVLNEPVVFTGAGYFLGSHAPGRRGLSNFLSSVHHVALSQAAGIRCIKNILPDVKVGTTFSCSDVQPFTDTEEDRLACKRIDALLNRLFLEPLIGQGYPFKELPFVSRIEKYFRVGDNEKLKAPFDFIGLQYYTRELVKHSWWTPLIKAQIVTAEKRKVFRTAMNWEVYPQGLFNTISRFSKYPEIKNIIITENGAAFEDKVAGNTVNDSLRQDYISDHIEQVVKAKNAGMPVSGYFVWSLTDNFEWAEGFRPRFGLVHVDFKSQIRTIKKSGYWYSRYIQDFQESNRIKLLGKDKDVEIPGKAK